ncbi:PucR family transcriptional regulator [Leifsonia poae]|uniref:PucR family transcriptional regulator n=1 Tax=Leifsonia poae TaxID=110933 RepID=A0A9W6HAS5_9MICO|nr:PucR family transcriptional regulator [Leifsonia poae]GLJ76418.1 PucR family transcriptional regulator [Leifsonia poae]
MPASLAQLLARPELALRLLTPSSPEALERPVPWVHSSELTDPTPFLSDGQVLLVTGVPDDVEPYVARLVGHGIAGLGFGTEVVRDGTPDALVDACVRHGLPLFEVPYRTPFIAIARFVADRVAADAYARNTWALRASRAISLAALRSDALGATLAELARQIERPVALVGAAGAVERVFPANALRASDRLALADGAEPLLRGRRRAAATAPVGADMFALQTLGAAGRLRGVLAIGGSESLDQAAQQVVTGVVALAGLALEQSRATDAARGRLRTAVWRALLAGDHDLAASIAEPVLGALPTGPVRVGLLTGAAVDAAAEWLELHPEESDLFARDGDGLVLLLANAAESAVSAESVRTVERVASRFELRGGVSAPGSIAGVARALQQATAALDRASADTPVRAFDDLAEGGMLALLQTDDARAVATAALAPLVAADPSLPAVLRTWLDHNGVYDVAARELGIHRHTLRARVADAERLLGRDLGDFAARADLYAALTAAG